MRLEMRPLSFLISVRTSTTHYQVRAIAVALFGVLGVALTPTYLLDPVFEYSLLYTMRERGVSL